MAGLVIDIKQLRKRGQSLTIPVEVAAVATDSEVQQPANDAGTTDVEPLPSRPTSSDRQPALESAIARLSEKNPALQQSMTTLDLEAIALISPPGHARLWDLSGRILKPGETSDRAELIRRLEVAAGVSADRAELGFKMMLDSHAIEPTGLPDQYFLGGSTPF